MIKFEDIYTYLKSALSTLASNQYSGNITSDDTNYDKTAVIDTDYANLLDYMMDAGDYLNKISQLPYDKAYEDNPRILVEFSDDGMEQATDSIIPVYYQKLTIFFFCPDRYRDDINTLLKQFSLDYKNKLDYINSINVQTEITGYPSTSEKIYEDKKYFNAWLEMGVMIYPTALLSNSIKVYLNDGSTDYELSTSDISTTRNYTLTADQRKFAETPSNPETSSMAITCKGPYQNTTIMAQLRKNHFLNNSFGTPYTLKIIDTTLYTTNVDGSRTYETIYNEKVIPTQSTFNYTFGAFSVYQISFTKYSDLLS